MVQASAAEGLEERLWYRTLQILRIIAYILLVLISWGGSVGSAPYNDVIPNAYGQLQSHPGTPFHWGLFLTIILIGWLLIELTRIGIIYILAGKHAATAASNQVFSQSASKRSTLVNAPQGEQELSPGQAELYKRTLFITPAALKRGVSSATMGVCTSIALNLLDGYKEKSPDMTDKLSVKEYEAFKSLLLEAIGVGFKLYFAERRLAERTEPVGHTGKIFEQYLIEGYQAYWVDDTKHPDDLISTETYQVVHRLGNFLMAEGLLKTGILEKFKSQEELLSGIVLGPSWLVSVGYTLAVLQENYTPPRKRL
jgi:hypothetical protein